MNVQTALLRLKQGLTGGNRELVNVASGELIAERAALGRQWRSVAVALARNGEWSLALAAVERFAEDTGDLWPAEYARANLLYESGRLPQALSLLDELAVQGLAPTMSEERVPLLNLRASIAVLLGRTEEARSDLAEALRLDPRSGQAWFSFAEVADFRTGDAASRDPLEQAFAGGSSLRGEGVKLAHAVGRMRHQLGDFAGAFAAFDAGAEQFRNATRNLTRVEPTLAETSTSFSAELIERISARITAPHDRVIFVSGLPRSGTTLVEQILVSHPAVTHGEELGFFRIIAAEIGGIDAKSLSRWLDAGGDPNRLVDLYMHLADERFGAGGRFVDKTVEAGNYMGLLLALFPQRSGVLDAARPAG